MRDQVCQGALTQKQTLLGRGGALQRGQALARWKTRSEGHETGQIDHLDVPITVRRLADRHFTTLICHFGSNLERRALYLALLDVARLAS